MRVFNTAILSLLLTIVFAQNDSATINLFNDVINRKTDTSVIAYLDKIAPEMYDYMERFAKRKIWDIREKKYMLRLTKHEQQSLLNQLKEARQTIWDDNLFPQSEKISDDKFREYLKEHPTREVYIFSKPVFIRNNTIALLYLVRLCCGGINGPVQTAYFKKTNEGWKQWAMVEGGAF